MKRNNIILITIIGLIMVVVVVIASNKPKNSSNTANSNTATGATTNCADELKICGNGTTVKREGETCDFPDCPNSDATATKNWRTYANASMRFSIQYPPIWNATADTDVVTLAASGVSPMVIDRIVDDTALFESSGHATVAIGAVTATQADLITADATTRMIWIPRDGDYLRVGWKRTGNDSPYYQILTTLKLE